MVREGLQFVRRNPVVLGCMSARHVRGDLRRRRRRCCRSIATDILQVGARGYGLLSASLEAGALLSSLALVLCRRCDRAGRALLIAVAVYGLATIAFGLSRWFPLSIALYMLVGIADQVSVVMRSTAIQLATPDALRGRVSAVNFIFIGASNQLGAAESGFVAALTSPTFAVVSGGVGCLIVRRRSSPSRCQSCAVTASRTRRGRPLEAARAARSAANAWQYLGAGYGATPAREPGSATVP